MSAAIVRPFSPVLPLESGTTLIEASAGTGKTWNISNLFVRLLAEAPTPKMAVDRILVVTFTEAATAELRDRIRKRLRAALAALERALPDDSPLPEDPVFAHLVAEGRQDGNLPLRAARLRTALECFDQSSISTIHGFCQRMLRLNAFESRVEFDQELVTDLRPYLEEVVQDFWVLQTHDLWETLVRHLQSRGLLDGLRTLAAKVCEDDELPILPPIRDDEPAPSESGREAWQQATRQFRLEWEASRAQGAQVLAAAIAEGRMKPSAFRIDEIPTILAAMERWLAAGTDPGSALAWPLQRLRRSGLEKGASVRKGVSNPPVHRLFDACEDLATALEGLEAHMDEVAQWLRRRFVGFARAQLARRKAELHVQSFQDLLRVLRERLRGDDGTRLRDAIRSRYDAALIDEFQDTDPVQWEIFQTVFGHAEGRLYLIGDPKQAIYAFRNADVFAYLRAKEAAPAVYTLTENHRSDRPVVEALNRLFGRLRPLPFAFEPIPFDRVTTPKDAVRLRVAAPPGHDGARDGPPQATVTPPPLRIRFLPGRPDGKPWSKDEADQRIPRLVARDIVDFLTSGAQVFDESMEGTDKWRAAVPGDLAILVRKNRQARAIQQALRDAGIPGVVHGADNVLQSEEAREIAFVLAAILEPSRMARVRTAVATRLLGCTANQVAALETDEAALDAWMELFHDLGLTWEKQGFARMFRELLDRQGVMARVLAWRDGERRMTNILHVAELAHRAEAEEDHRPESLLGWLGRQIAAAEADSDAVELRLETDADAVDIVTMHRCKGLEYRVTWCPYLWDNLTVGGDGKMFRAKYMEENYPN
jgi:exodeoxyribonuclease V beta subunit